MYVEEPAREGFLYHLWLERNFTQSNLHTIDGIPVEIYEKGERNFDAGPDFLNALVKIGDSLSRGSVEVHSIAGDWYAHGHHRDPRYNDVILHLITMECPPEFKTLAANGKHIPILNLDQFLEKPAEELEYEHTELPVSPPKNCQLAELPLAQKHRLIEKYADERFRLKTERFLELVDLVSWEQAFYLELFGALGYSKNQTAFKRLAQVLPVDKLWQAIWNDPEEKAYLKAQAFLFGAAGLLVSQKFKPEPIYSDYVLQLETLWKAFPLKKKLDVMPTESWQFFRMRPQNFPSRRIAAAAGLVCRFMNDGFVQTCTKTLERTAAFPKKWIQELEKLFCVQSDYYWQVSYQLDSNTRQTLNEKNLLGGERSRDIVVNIVLPALAAFAFTSHDNRLNAIVTQIYNSYPKCSDNDWTRAMRQKLQPNLRGTGARFQQGLLYIRDFCLKQKCDACTNGKLRFNPHSG